MLGCGCDSGLFRLTDVEKGKQVEVVGISGPDELKRKILDMGLVPGTIVTLQRKAPLDDPISIRLRGYELSLRRSEAEAVVVSSIGCSGCSMCREESLS